MRKDLTNREPVNCAVDKGLNQKLIQLSKETNIQKYGVDNPWKTIEVQNKCKSTIIKNNGGLGAASNVIKEKMKQRKTQEKSKMERQKREEQEEKIKEAIEDKKALVTLESEIKEKLWPLPVNDLFMCGKKTSIELNK